MNYLDVNKSALLQNLLVSSTVNYSGSGSGSGGCSCSSKISSRKESANKWWWRFLVVVVQ